MVQWLGDIGKDDDTNKDSDVEGGNVAALRYASAAQHGRRER